MHGWTHKSARQSKTQNPSFSSTLLDEIYGSIDSGDAKPAGGGRARASGAVEDEGIATLRRAFLVQKWMDMKVNAKSLTHRRRASSLPDSDRKPTIDDDDQFWSSGSVCRRSHRPSCFGPLGPKLAKADVFMKKHQPHTDDRNVKKVKEPISPGARLTTFLNSLFTNGRLKKPQHLSNEKIERTSKSTHGSTCSSASSFTRSCLSKHSPRSREKLNNGTRRTVRFYPVSVIIDEESRPCGEKFIFGEQDLMKVRVTTMLEDKIDDDDYDDNDNDDDFASDASSDLFELDHLKECDELPVYETTHFGTNRAIANGLIY
ncbi:hypothetical protein SSX86_026041 [Deinandra increscens subsp. villosa]|uniref:Protein BIG GRAIN 1-like B n=1 Tax=Deinandra increscens subsp. villosa TaxID=3103831 RepID=A0AAP0CIW1_9ASTR